MALEKTDNHPLVIIQSFPLSWGFLVSALGNQQIPPRSPKVISKYYSGTSLVVQWLGLHASNAGGGRRKLISVKSGDPELGHNRPGPGEMEGQLTSVKLRARTRATSFFHPLWASQLLWLRNAQDSGHVCL